MKDDKLTRLALRYREAWLTSQRLPSGIAKLGFSSAWPEMVYDQREQLRRAERERVRVCPTAEEIDRLVECTHWLTLLDDAERKLIWLRASGLDWRSIARRTGTPRTTIYRYWHKTLLKLLLELASHNRVTG